MTSELKKARRVLAQLERRLLLVRRGAGISEVGGQLWMEAERWERELTAQVKRQELEVRRVSCTSRGFYFNERTDHAFSVWKIAASVYDDLLVWRGKTMRGAIAWAERQNRKEGGI